VNFFESKNKIIRKKDFSQLSEHFRITSSDHPLLGYDVPDDKNNMAIIAWKRK